MTLKIGDTARQRCRQPNHCPCGSLTTKSRKGSRQGGCPPGRSANRCPLLGFDLPVGNRRFSNVTFGGHAVAGTGLAGSRCGSGSYSEASTISWVKGVSRSRRRGLRRPLCQIDGNESYPWQQRLPDRDGIFERRGFLPSEPKKLFAMNHTGWVTSQSQRSSRFCGDYWAMPRPPFTHQSGQVTLSTHSPTSV